MATTFRFDWNAVKESIQKEDSEKKKGFEKDARFWKQTPDSKGEANVVFRFLPDLSGTPYVKLYSHSFDFQVAGQKKYWIKNCVNTFGYDKECPICKKNMELWNSAFESDKALASKRKRKLQFISNVYIIKNPNDPESEGKVVLFKYGQKIYDKIKAKMFPSEADKLDDDFIEFVPFDLYTGADFRLTVTKQGDFPNYDLSKFSTQKPLLGGDDKKIDTVMNSTYLLSEFVDLSQFPSNEETIKTLGQILGLTDPEESNEDSHKSKIKTKAVVKKDEPDDFDLGEEKEVSGNDDIDEDLEFFKSIK